MTETAWLLGLVDEAFDTTAWHGPNLRGTVRGVTAELAAWRPAPPRHTIQEIVLHTAYWKYAARRRLTAEKRGSFPLSGSNWFARETADPQQWRDDLQLLNDIHHGWRTTIERLSATQLCAAVGKGKLTVRQLVRGVAFHDVYHAGQIQTLKRLAADRA